MKYLALAILLLYCCLCEGQTYRFKLYRTAACQTKPYLDTDYSLSKGGIGDKSYSPVAGTVFLPGPGKYEIELGDGPHIDTTFNIRDTGLIIFTYRDPDVGVYYNNHIFDYGPKYKSCGNLIQGFLEDRLPDGRIRMRGNFLDGSPKDSIVKFFENGLIKSRWKRYKRYNTREEFDSTGYLAKVYTQKNSSFMLYHWRKVKEFFPDGKIKLMASSFTHSELYKEFYPNGQIKIDQTKKHRFEYTENGVLLLSFVWQAHHSEFGEKHQKDFKVTKKVFDRSGALAKTIVFECWSTFDYPPRLFLSGTNWIDSIILFKNGKGTVKVADISTEDYMKKYSYDDDPGFRNKEW